MTNLENKTSMEKALQYANEGNEQRMLKHLNEYDETENPEPSRYVDLMGELYDHLVDTGLPNRIRAFEGKDFGTGRIRALEVKLDALERRRENGTYPWK